MEDRSSEFIQRVAKLSSLKEAGIDPYPNDFKPSNTAAEINAKFAALSAEEILTRDDRKVVVAGRIVAKRDFGKASFIQIQDRTGRVQAYMKKDILGEEGYNLFKGCDLGDIVGIKGSLFRTRTGELTIESDFPRAPRQGSPSAA